MTVVAVSIGRVIGLLVLVLVLYAVISQPLNSAGMARDGAGHLGDAGGQAATFMTALFGGSTSDGSTDVVPLGGAATGDGSSAP